MSCRLSFGLALLLVGAAAAAQEVSLTLPAGCTLAPVAGSATGMESCRFTGPDGDARSLTLEVLTESRKDLPPDREEARDVLEWLVVNLLTKANTSHPGPGRTLALSRIELLPRGALGEGFDACAVYDYDFVDRAGPIPQRLSDSGAWCFGLKPQGGMLVFVKLEYLALTLDPDDRPPGFAAEAARVIGSLALDW